MTKETAPHVNDETNKKMGFEYKIPWSPSTEYKEVAALNTSKQTPNKKVALVFIWGENEGRGEQNPIFWTLMA